MQRLADRLLYLVGIITLLITIVFSFQYSYATLIDRYSPSIDALDRIPNSPTPDTEVQIFANVTDKFATIRNATLFYSTDGGIKWQKVKMDLIYGTLADGVFSGIIPKQTVNTEVSVKLYFEDNLGYSGFRELSKYDVSTDHEPPEIDGPNLSVVPAPWDYVKVTSNIQDYASGVKNVTLHYSVNNAQYVDEVMSLDKEKSRKGKWDGLYETSIPPFPEGTKVDLFLEAYDNANNYSNATSSYIVKVPQTKRMTINFDISKLEARNIIGPVNVTATGILPTDKAFIPIGVSVFDIKTQGFSLRNQLAFKTFEASNVGIFAPQGDPWNYPIDHYSLNLTFSIPFKDVQVDYAPIEYSDRAMSQYWVKPNVVVHTSTIGESTVSNIVIRLERNPFYSFIPIIFPLTGAFALVGGTFVLDNSKSQLANRLVITLGAFAFLFSFGTIIDNSKPLFAFGLPTLAENMVGQLLTATIAYTISTLVGYRVKSLVVDIVIFVYVAYSSSSILYDSQFRIELIILVVIGLGYGFLFRWKDILVLKGQIMMEYWVIRRKLGISPVKI